MWVFLLTVSKKKQLATNKQTKPATAKQQKKKETNKTLFDICFWTDLSSFFFFWGGRERGREYIRDSFLAECAAQSSFSFESLGA